MVLCSSCSNELSVEHPGFPLPCGRWLHLFRCPLEFVAQHCCVAHSWTKKLLLQEAVRYVVTHFPKTFSMPDFAAMDENQLEAMSSVMFTYKTHQDQVIREQNCQDE